MTLVPQLLVREPEGVVHCVRPYNKANGIQAKTLCGLEFYFSQNQHLWQVPPHDHPWWTAVSSSKGAKVTCLACIANGTV